MEVCPGCAATFEEVDGPTHRYMTSSPGCWHRFNEVLAADYASPERMAFHQVVVDAYAAQHPGDGSLPQQVQSVGLHLMTLCLFLEHGADPALGTQLHRRMIGRPQFRRLERSGPGELTVADLPEDASPEATRAAALAWAACVWETYRAEHATVREWLRACGFTLAHP